MGILNAAVRRRREAPFPGATEIVSDAIPEGTHVWFKPSNDDESGLAVVEGEMDLDEGDRLVATELWHSLLARDAAKAAAETEAER